MAWLWVFAVACGSDDASDSQKPAKDAGSDVEVDAGDDAGDAATCAASGVSKRPWVQHVTETSALVRWEACAEGSDPGLTFSPEAGGASQTVQSTVKSVDIPNTYAAAFQPQLPKDEAGRYYMHDATLTGLAAGACYSYALSADASQKGRFCTARPSGASFKILATGDTNPGLGATPKLLGFVKDEGYDLTLHAGDVQYYASGLETWVTWFQLMEPMLAQGAFLPAVGNHEYEKPDEFPLYYQRFFDQAGFDGQDGYFRAQSGGVWFFFWNTEIDDGPTSAQFAWFQANLADAAKQPGYRFSIFVLHKPMLTCGDKSQNDSLRATLQPLFEQYAVPLVLQGHMHGYERFEVPMQSDATKAITYLTIGGGGGALEDIDKNIDRPTCQLRQAKGKMYQMTVLEVGTGKLSGRTIDVQGTERDTFEKAVP